MPRYTGWKTVIDGQEKKHRSENKAYEWLRAWSAGQPDGAKAEVFVQEPYRTNWALFERLVVDNGRLGEA